MSNPLYGQIPEFYGDGDDWNVYYERLEQFFSVNDIPEDKRSAFLISVIGSYTYKTLRDLCHPVLPKDKPFEELCEQLRRQFSPQISVFRERSKFYNSKQEAFENVSTWYAKVKKLSVNCKFGSNLDLVLLDKFITGLRSGPILDRLCEEIETLTLREALDIAVNKESALAVELPPSPENQNCFECCVPPPREPIEDQPINNNIASRPASSAASDSGFKEPQIAICPTRNSIFRRQSEQNNQSFEGVVKDFPVRCRKTSKALLGKPIGLPMAEMPLRAASPPIALEMTCEMAPTSNFTPLLSAASVMRTTIEDASKVNDVSNKEPVNGDDVNQEKKKKTRRGCRGGRKHKKSTSSA